MTGRDSEEIQQTVESIRVITKDIDAKETGLKFKKDQLKEIIESMPEWLDVEESALEHSAAKEKLRIALMSNARYNDLAESIANESADLRDDKDILSKHVVEYYASTHEHQIEIDESNGDARQIIVNGKLGKGGKYQPSLFSDDARIEISDGQTSMEMGANEFAEATKRIKRKSKVASDVH